MSRTSEVSDPYRLLFQHNPQPMWVYDTESLRFLAVNDTALTQYGYSREEFLNMGLPDIRPPEDVPALEENLRRAGAEMERTGTWRHRRRDGSLIQVEIHSNTLTFEGRPAQLVLALDVSDREHAFAALRQSNDEYERQYKALVTLTRENSLQTADVPAALRTITEFVSRTLDVARVSIWRFTPARDGIATMDLFEDSTGQHSSGHVLEGSQFPGYFRALEENDVISADDAETDPRTREFTESYLRPLGITSMMDTPILIDGRLEGVMCLEHVGQRRTWSAGERSFAMSVTNLVALLLAQRARAESEARLKAIFDSEPECVKIVSRNGEVLDMNPAGLRLLEAEQREQVVSRPVSQLIHPDDWPAFSALHRRVLEGEVGTLEFRMVTLRGRGKWMEMHAAPLRDAAGEVTSMLSVTHDITERRRWEAELAESRRQLATLLDNLPGMAYRCRNNRDRTMEFVSDGVALLTGYNASQIVRGGGVTYGDLIHPDDRERAWDEVQAAVGRGEQFEIEYRIRAASGSEKWVWERGQAVYNADRTAELLEGFVTDVTERRRAEEQLLHSQRLESVGRLAGGIAHDFNNLLTVILGTIDLDLREIAEDSPLRRDLLDIRRAGERAAQLTRQLLAFSRRQVLQPVTVNLNDLVADMLVMLGRLIGEDIEIRFKPAEDLHPVKVDPGQFEQVLVNLAVNARDAMPRGGQLTIETGNVVLDEAWFETHAAARPGPHAMLAISDTGVGMDESVKKHLFEPFFTTKPVGEGTGLGLAMVYGTVQQSEGAIRVYTEVGKGTTFRIYLPQSEAAPTQDLRETAPQPPRGGTETVLIVEDEAGLRRLARRVLQSSGYTVLVAGNGQEALKVLAEHAGPVHLLLTDVVMPGISGPELASQVAELHPGIRIVYMSGYADDAMIRHGVPGSHQGFINKPFTLAELTAAVQRALAE